MGGVCDQFLFLKYILKYCTTYTKYVRTYETICGPGKWLNIELLTVLNLCAHLKKAFYFLKRENISFEST